MRQVGKGGGIKEQHILHQLFVAKCLPQRTHSVMLTKLKVN